MIGRLRVGVLVGLAVLACAGCDESEEMNEKLGVVDDRMTALEGKVDNITRWIRYLDKQEEEAATSTSNMSVSLDQRIADIARDVADIEDKIDQPYATPRTPPARSRPTLDSDAVYSVPVDGAPFVGADDALVTLVEGYEFACPFCFRARGVLDELRAKYKDELKIVYKSFIVHPYTATPPALAACAAHRQGKFAEMAELIWTKGFDAGRNLAADHMESLAEELKLDLKKYRRDAGGPCKKIIDDDRNQLAAIGVAGTPTFFINGRYLGGLRPVTEFVALIEEEKRKAELAVAGGTKPADYYREHVVQAGKKTR